MPTRVAENLWRLDIPLVGNPLKNLNSYLITGERSLLIDTGFRQRTCREAMERELTETGIDRGTMDIFLTHRHSDHSGLAQELSRDGCQIYIGEIDGKALIAYTDEVSGDTYWRRASRCNLENGFSADEMANLWTSNPAKTYSPLPNKPYTLLQDGHELHYGGYTLRCILTPGHTPGHMCLYEPARQWLFSGDHVLFHITPNICRWEESPDSLGDYLESLRKYRDLPVKLLLPAHREETGELAVRVDELLAHHERRLANTIEVLKSAPGIHAYALAGKMRWKIHARSWEEFPLPQKHFAVGETLAHLDYLELRGRVRRELRDGVYFYYALS